MSNVNIQQHNTVVSELKSAGFINCEQRNCMDYNIYQSVMNALDTINVFGYDYWVKNTCFGEKLRTIINKIVNTCTTN